ncbi:MAG TPA: CTP synthase [Cytophagales bacterium]|nr:CTP synthase [Cytophagales bacterium]HRR08383.1 CTP synthase [Rhodothermales bacterium]
METKYIFVTGGVTSSLGKGILIASLGRLLEARGLRVTIQKFDPYINVDPGTMNPYEHGEVYVTNDGAETDLDLGHYERYLGIPMSQANSVSTGRIYSEVIRKERAGEYLGKTVQVVPHIIDEIKSWMTKLGNSGDYDVVMIEVGGTVGDIESQPYLEAIRQLSFEMGRGNTCDIHLTLVPYLSAAGELKTKPTQYSVKTLLGHGIQPDVLVCRSEMPIEESIRRKIALFCNVPQSAVIAALDAGTIYDVPLLLQQEGLDKVVCEILRLNDALRKTPDMRSWIQFLKRLKHPKHTVKIGVVGKYVDHQDAYKSITESFVLAGAANEVAIDLKLIHSENLTPENIEEKMEGLTGVLVAPGFGSRGIPGKISAIRYAREHNIPFLGICLGMQCAVIEFARNVCGWASADSTEFDPDTPYPVINLMESQKEITQKGGTMRLGLYDCIIEAGTNAYEAYGKTDIQERHRHRYEVNNDLRYKLRENGLVFSGINPKQDLVEIIEWPEHRWFVGAQFHPEYQSNVNSPHPLFLSFIKACIQFAKEKGLIEIPKPKRKRNKPDLASSDV